jgi:hypothetical protein
VVGGLLRLTGFDVATGAGSWQPDHHGGSPIMSDASDAARTAGVAAGVDYKLSSDALLGFALAGRGTSWALSQGLGGGSRGRPEGRPIVN